MGLTKKITILQKSITLFFSLIFMSCSLLQGCASSGVSRGASGDIENAYEGTSESVRGIGKGDMAESYQNSSQTQKGLLIGGVTGGLIGGMSHGVGLVAGVATGAILGGALGAYIDANTTLVDKLKNRGASVFVLGDQVLIVLPSRHMFYSMTSEIKYTAYSTLDLVAKLIGDYTNISVKVAAYTNAWGPERVELALSQQQAENVTKYLWKRGINTRLLYAKGYGGTHLVTKNSLDWDKSDNYRIEITLEKLPV